MAAVPKTERSKQDQLAICLEAHEALANLDQANADKFADVITLMRQQGRPEQAVH
jgi:hypothetical protein